MTSLDDLVAYVMTFPERKVLCSEEAPPADFRRFRLGGPTFSPAWVQSVSQRSSKNTPCLLVLGGPSSSPRSFDVDRVRLRGLQLRCWVGEEDEDAPESVDMGRAFPGFQACSNVGTTTSTLPH